MGKLLGFVWWCLSAGYCAAQASLPTQEAPGIIFFSTDNGYTWKDASRGLPQHVSVGIDGIDITGQQTGVATREYGVYLYDTGKAVWTGIPTAKEIIGGNIGALALYDRAIFVGTQYKGLFRSADGGLTWVLQNLGRDAPAIRRFIKANGRLYVCTNGGFYVYDGASGNWLQEYGQDTLQVNGAAVFNGCFYLATTQGVYKQERDKTWTNVLPGHSLHNISSDRDRLYAMTYNALLLSSADGGKTWQSLQSGLPDLYTFHVLTLGGEMLAGQWDGIYRRAAYSTRWELSGKGLPPDYAVTNLKAGTGLLVVSTSGRE